MEMPYHPDSKSSIVLYAKQLRGKTLRQVCTLESIRNNHLGKGYFGQTLEEFYFHYKPNSDSAPDFPLAGIELKSSPLKKLNNASFRSKERLVLNIINYLEVVHQEFETSSFWKKNNCLLLVFYLHEADKEMLDYDIKLVEEWHFPAADLEIIKKDWAFIRKKIADGKAHELSEGDTFYLGACTKGANANSMREQPFSDIPAKQRAYSLKQGYVNHIIASIANEPEGIYGKLIPNIEVAKSKSIEEIVMDRFKLFYRKSIENIMQETGTVLNQNSKNFYAQLTKAILGIALDKEIAEFEKADIIVKSIRVEADNRIKESISFRQIDYVALAEETWEYSDFKEILEHKFLFIFFKEFNGSRVLEKARFWNMPYGDIQEAKKVWEHTRQLVRRGNIVQRAKPDGTRKTNFMGKSDNPVSHVRPHAANAADTSLLPVKDQLTQSIEYTKHSFWLNNDYVKNKIFLEGV